MLVDHCYSATVQKALRKCFDLPGGRVRLRIPMLKTMGIATVTTLAFEVTAPASTSTISTPNDKPAAA